MDKQKKITEQATPVPIVSSEHLASEDSWPLSELEYGMIIAHNAFSRWMIRCMQGAGYADFSPLDVLVLHNVNHRNRQKKLVDICFLLHIEDQHTVNYSLKKLVKSELVQREKHGKEIYYSTTPQGKKACERYREVREKCLTSGYRNLDREGSEVSQAAALLRLMSGLYDQASRAASSL
jgi:predicted MarR family transcription regulator